MKVGEKHWTDQIAVGACRSFLYLIQNGAGRWQVMGVVGKYLGAEGGRVSVDLRPLAGTAVVENVIATFLAPATQRSLPKFIDWADPEHVHAVLGTEPNPGAGHAIVLGPNNKTAVEYDPKGRHRVLFDPFGGAGRIEGEWARYSTISTLRVRCGGVDRIFCGTTHYFSDLPPLFEVVPLAERKSG